MDIFSYWEIDPNGWGRHMFVGMILMLLAKGTRKYALFFFTALFLALLKEFYDSIWGMGYLVVKNALADIVFTLIPFIILLLWKPKKKVSYLDL